MIVFGAGIRNCLSSAGGFLDIKSRTAYSLFLSLPCALQYRFNSAI